jgi:hypothetical protein
MAFMLRGLDSGPVIFSPAALPPCSQASVGQQCTPDGSTPAMATLSFSPSRLRELLTVHATAVPTAGGNIMTSPPPGLLTTAPGAAKPWYMTWWGIALIVGGGYFGYKWYSKPKAA